jgi:diguanylate cyclase (GGDEF)-like protein/PAS domain S-box-containing protein
LNESSIVPLIVMAAVRDPVDSINGILRRAGHPVQCTWIPALRDLADALTQLNPEILVCAPADPGHVEAVAKIRDQTAPSVPLVVLTDGLDENLVAEAMVQGARDAVSLANPARLQAVMARELRAFRLERALQTTLQSSRDYRRQLETVLQRSADAIAHIQEGIVVDANAAWLELFGIPDRVDVVGQPLMDLFDEDSHAALKGALVACLQGRWSDHPLKVTANLADGSQLAMEFLLTPGEYDEEPSVRLTMPAQRRDERALARELADAVRRDAATGLLHRRPLLETLSERLKHPAPGGVRFIVVVKPDKFAAVERELGLAASETLLGEFVALLKAHCQPKDVIGRLGGTSFLVLLERGNERDVEAWAEQFVERTAKHVFRLEDKTVSVTCTLGLSVVPHAKPNVDAALSDALDAQRRGRGQGGNQAASSARSDADQRVQSYDKVWVKHIRAALIENRFRLVQQPIASLRGEDPQMFDVLVRMLDPQGKEVLPSEFMPAAERNELLKNIDRWVIGASLSFAAQRRPGCLFVRLSKDSALDATLPEWLDTQLRASKVEAPRVCFQVTEQVASSYLTQVAALGRLLRSRRFRFAIERFGSGRAPQSLFESVPLDFLKIDGALMQGLATNQDLQQQVRSIAEEATRRSILTIAERVEDANTMAVLWQLGVQFIQGYFVNAPEDVTL